MVDTGLRDRVVLVTGANHGIGAATAQAFAAEGASVFIHYLSLPAEASDANVREGGEARYRAQRALSADAVVQAIRDAGGRAEAWEADLVDPATVPQLFDRAEAALGPVDVLVNNAAYWEPDSFLPPQVGTFDPFDRPLPTITSENHDRHFAVNSRAVALMISEYARRLIERGSGWGRVINVSTDGAPGFRGQVSYGASKYALESYSRAAAGELGPDGITVNIVSPGPIQTGYISADLEQRLLDEIPLGRLGQPEDVADVVVFLASEQARWITGAVLYVGGGHRMI